MTRDLSKLILPVGTLILAYYILQNFGIIGCIPDPIRCPKGEKYFGWWQNCDQGYKQCGWLGESCCCEYCY